MTQSLSDYTNVNKVNSWFQDPLLVGLDVNYFTVGLENDNCRTTVQTLG